MAKTLPKWASNGLHQPAGPGTPVHEAFRHAADVERVAEALRAAGIPAYRDATGACSSDEEGHFHASMIVIRGITRADAMKLLPPKARKGLG